MRRVLAALLCLATACALLLAGAPGTAGAAAPFVTGWWSATNAGAVAAPAPPDVKQGDLLVQGSNVAPAGVVPGVLAPPSDQAISAVSFAIPPGSVIGPLRLRLDPDAAAPPASSVTACRVTAAFRAAENGPYADVPPFDAAACVNGQLSADGTSLTFAEVAGLVRGATLSLALVPGPLDRVVLDRPASTALALSTAGHPVGPAAPAFGAAGPPTFAGGTAPGAPADTRPAAAPLPAVPTAAASLPASLAPPSVAAPAPAAAAPAAPTDGLGSRTSRLVAGIGLLALVAFALLGPAREPGGRLAVPRSSSQRPALPQPAELGVGRFRSLRDGKAPRLS